MHYYLDTEFNGFGGDLISLALVPEDGDQPFYTSLPLPEAIDPWVERHVIPYLRHVPPGIDHEMSRQDAGEHVATYLSGDRDPVIVADWPEDIAQFCMLLLPGPRDIVGVGSLRFELLRTPGFSAAASSQVPHNAFHDAQALRKFCGY